MRNLLSLSLFLCAVPLAAQTTYTDATASAGLIFTHTPAPGHPMSGMVGGGSVGDFNRDGWPDLYLCSGGTVPDALFINQGDGTFVDEAAQWGLTDSIYASGTAVGDYDRDGWPDLYVSSFGDPVNGVYPGANRLYHNDGNGHFTEVAVAAGVNAGSDGADSFSACWGDYDRDGWLDLFVCAYGPLDSPNRLYHNEGDGSFRLVNATAGLSLDKVHGLACSFTDLDDDRYPDLLVIGDTGTSRAYRNLHGGVFVNRTPQVQELNEPNGMGIATGDLDQDGDLDFYVSDIYWTFNSASGNKLYWNDGAFTFHEGAYAAGCNLNGWGWGAVATDCDNDGLLDLAAVNGWAGSWGNYPMRLFHGLGGGSFVDEATNYGIDDLGQGRGLLRLDADQDGDEDLVVLHMGEPLLYLRNDGGSGNPSLELSFDTSADPQLAPDGIGTTVRATVGGRLLLRQLDSGQSYLGQSESMLFLGLGQSPVVDELRVEWEDGFTTVYHQLPPGRLRIVAPAPFTQSPLRRGAVVDFSLQGLEPGENATFVASLAGPGAGPQVARLGGLNVDLLPPLRWLGTAVADGSGVATLSRTMPAHAPLVAVSTQAFVARGPGGVDSLKSPVLTETVQ